MNGTRSLNHAAARTADPSLFTLVLSNVLAMIAVVWDQWNINDLIFLYWLQSVIIGLFNFLKILSLSEFSSEGVTINGHSVPATNETRRTIAFFFAFHYGFFHLLYFVFICEKGLMLNDGPIFFLLAATGFFLHHLFSFLFNEKNENVRKPNIGTIMALPYARIIPMHAAILTGSFFVTTGGASASIIFFSVLKTVADVIMHLVEHNARRPCLDNIGFDS